MADDFTILRYMSWRDICPWILLVRVFRIAISVRVLALSFVAVVMTTVVWNFSRTCCLSTESLDDSRFADVRLGLEEWPSNRIPLTFDGIGQTIQSPPLSLLHELCPVTNSFMTIAGPFFRLFGDGVPWDRWLYLLLGGSLKIGRASCRERV